MMKQLLLLSLIALISPVTSEKPHFRDDAADKVSWKFKNTPRKGTDVSVVVLNWEPSSMIENTGAISKEDFGVEIKAGVDGEFTAVEQEPRLKGGKYSYEINIVPCLEQFIRFVAKNSEGSTYFEHPETIPASSSEDIAKSSYNLLPIEDGTLEKTGDLLTLTWSPSECASSYLVILQGTDDQVEHETTETRLEMSLQELTEECGQYDVSVISVRDDKFSSAHFVSSLLTAPSESAVEELEVKVFPRAQSVMARWWGFKSMPCVSKYSVSLCKEDEPCQESVSLTLDDSLAYVEFSSEETLAECSQYSLRIKPEYEGTELQEKTVGFQTLSPGLAEVTAMMSPITAELRSDQQVQVSWPHVNCAAHYRLYQQAVTDSNPSHDWDFVTETTDTTATIPGVPCTEYIYGVRVVIDGEESEIVKMDQPIITSLDKSKPYTAPGLTVETSTSSVELSWDHATCVQSYRVELCPGEEECLEEVIATTNPQVTLTLHTLSPCTDYTVSIFARTDDQEIAEAAMSNFQTDAPVPEAPEDFSLVEDPVQKTLKLSFSGQKCATQYKVYEVLDQEEPSERVIDLNHLTVEIPPPCTEYKYAVAAMVGAVEGPRTEYIGEKVPPKDGDPSLLISQKYNTTVELQLLSPDDNNKCQIESYLVKYQNLGEDMEVLEATIPITELTEDNLIVLDNFPAPVDNGMKVEGRIKYLGFDWSPWVSSQSKVPEIVIKEVDGIIVPIVIGSLVALVTLVVVIFFVVKRKKRSQNKYDCDMGDKSESKKLNEGDV